MKRRLIIAGGSFVAASGLLGAAIIAHGLVNSYGLSLYGGMGKVALFSAICWAVLVRRSAIRLPVKAWQYRQLGWLGICAVAALSGLGLAVLLSRQASWIIAAGLHAMVCLSAASSLLAGFGWQEVLGIVRRCRRQAIQAVMAGGGFYGLLLLAYASWPLLAGSVLYIVKWLLQLGGIPTRTVPPYTLALPHFAVTVAKYCSGIESLAMFGGLYLLCGLLFWPRLKHGLFILSLPILLALLVLCNCLRIYGLVMLAYAGQPKLAFGLFHTYLGMVIFLLYAWGCWRLLLPRLMVDRRLAIVIDK